MKRYLNNIAKKQTSEGNVRRLELLSDILKNGTFVPKTVEYSDIDADFKRWAEELRISYNGTLFPTMVMYSNQRFTEYSQTWKYVDKNKNLILNFKTITRETNPQYGKIQQGLWNIPGNRFYKMKKQLVLDDNGSESILCLKVKQPMAIDLMYKLSIFTTNIDSINEFNMMINDAFKSRQAYIRPNGHYMPMTLEGITDKSSYQINDRQFYSQTAQIKVMAYILREGDFKVEEYPYKVGVNFGVHVTKPKAGVEIEEVNPCEQHERYYYQPVRLIINFPAGVKKVEFSELGQNIVITSASTENVCEYSIFINEERAEKTFPIGFKDKELVKIQISRKSEQFPSTIIFEGYDPDNAIDSEAPDYSKEAELKDTEIEYEIDAGE